MGLDFRWLFDHPTKTVVGVGASCNGKKVSLKQIELLGCQQNSCDGREVREVAFHHRMPHDVLGPNTIPCGAVVGFPVWGACFWKKCSRHSRSFVIVGVNLCAALYGAWRAIVRSESDQSDTNASVPGPTTPCRLYQQTCYR